MDRSYTETYAELYRRHWWWQARERFILDTIRGHALCDGRCILDVGCAAGGLFPGLAACGRVEGVEPDPGLREQAGGWREHIHLGPLDDSFQPDHAFGLILMLDVLEHVVDPRPMLRRALDLLEPHGTLLITVPAFQVLWTAHDEINVHYRRYDERSFRVLAGEVGLQIRETRYFFHWLAGAKLVTRALEAVLGQRPRVPTVPAAWMNRTLFHLCRLEQVLSRKVRVPCGSSLLVLGGRTAR